MEGMVKQNFIPPYDSFNDLRVLITGHSGFQGAWLTRWLQILGSHVCGISLEGKVTEPDLFSLLKIDSEIQEHRFNINDINSTLKIVHNFQPDLIIHLAGQSLVFKGFEDSLNTFQTNVLGTICLLEAVKSCEGIKGVVIATSDKCYQNDDSENAFNEHSILGGNDPYSASKAAAEIAVNAYRSIPGMPPLATVRAGNVIGGGDWGPKRLIPDLMRSVFEKKTATIRHPKSTRPWQHVLDCLNGYLVIAHHQLKHQAANEPFNIGPRRGQNISVETIIKQFTNEWTEINWIQSNDSAVGLEKNHLMLDSSYATNVLGWKPKLPFDKAVSWTIDWYRRSASSKTLSICDEQIMNFMSLSSSED